MKLSLEQIKSITTGAVRIEEDNGNVRFFRFTEEQEELYKKVSLQQDRKFYDRCTTTAGIRLVFNTDSQTLKIKIDALKRTSRTYFSFDVFVNGASVGYLDNFSHLSLPQDYTEAEFMLGEFSKEFDLGKGAKQVCVYFPWSVCPVLKELHLDDGAFIEAIKPKKKLLAFGDSITQGYDALRPSMRYAAKLADSLEAEEFNKGIGGEVFFPELAKVADSFSPDYITVAYGTNDFSKSTEEDFKVRCKEFYLSLSKAYPHSKIFAITPIWRKDYAGERVFGSFEKVEEGIREAVAGLENVTMISGFDLVPKSDTYFSDLRLHPNDAGFAHYSKNLYNKIKAEIERNV